ncbi:cortex morphogenetic protein CmpA [Paenibacillus sp. MMS18-CY102]|nr:cortex morphogenetic protein CmpA [Paenibacillus sp. MMS18-CY102]MWC31352.1 cortex morphogenetic protein CmpA [Paenibacillus sp. MMS18-CY102]
MPQWLCNQLMRAYQKKDIRQIRLLNDCWFFYRTKQRPSEDSVTIN